MSLDIKIYNGSRTVTLSDGTIYGILSENNNSSIGIIDTARVFSRTWGRDFHPLGGYSRGNRIISFTGRIEGTSLDDWITNYRTLENILFDTQEYWTENGVTGAKATLSIKLNGMTNATEFDIITGDLEGGSIFTPSMQINTSNPMNYQVKVSLVVKPFGRPQARTEVTVGTYSQTTGGSDFHYAVAASSFIGDVPSTANVEITPSSTTLYRMIMGRKTIVDGSGFFSVFNCYTGTYTSASDATATYTVTALDTDIGIFTVGSDAVDASAWNAKVRKYTVTGAAANSFTNGNLVKITINNHLSNYYGAYRVFLLRGLKERSDINQAFAFTDFTLTYGGSSGTSITNTTVLTGASLTERYLIDLGRLQVPGSSTNPIQNFIFTIKASASFNVPGAGLTASDSLNAIILVPIDEKCHTDVQVTNTTYLQSGETLVVDGLSISPAIYVLDTAGYKLSTSPTVNDNTFGQIVPKMQNIFVAIFAKTVTGNYPVIVPGDSYQMKLKFHHNYAMLR